MLKIISIFIVLILMACNAFSQGYINGAITDHYKTVTKKIPYQVKVCSETPVYSRNEGIFYGPTSALRGELAAISGAAAGGIIGHQFGRGWGRNAATTAGAFIGSNVGHQIYQDRRNSVKTCTVETHYKTVSEKVYSHSTATFYEKGRQRTLTFKK
ncbi:MAG: glycine zipper 2TM domain-containing protein [Desulfuromonas sp.]|nr:glycine zipper 2TM domain-containing protein [Desulfuromonas sp.]